MDGRHLLCLFQALKGSLIKNGLSFDNVVSFMSDTTNVMKGVRSDFMTDTSPVVSHNIT